MPTAERPQQRVATASSLAPWIGELLRTLPGLVSSYRPGGALDARTRERVILAVTESNGCRYSAWIHGGWAAYVGADTADEVDDALLTYARACAEAGRPVDAAPLHDVLSAEGVAAVRATVARVEVENLVGNSADSLFDRLTRRPDRLLAPAALREAVTTAFALPFAVPLTALSAAMRVVSRLAPAPPEIDVPASEEPNLLAHLLLQALPVWFGNASIRLATVGLPVSVSVAVRSGRTTATVTFGRGRAAVANGIRRDAVIVLEGDVEPLLQAASGRIARELGAIRIRPS